MSRVAGFVVGVVLVLCWSPVAYAQVEDPPVFVLKWRPLGIRPAGVATDPDGDVYVVQRTRSPIVQKFDSVGNPLTTWGFWGGNADGRFLDPFGVATDSAGNVYVADAFNHRIQKFDGVGNFQTKWSAFGVADGLFNVALGVATDAAGNVYVADFRNHRIQRFDSTGSFETTWGTFGVANGQFNFPHNVATDAAGNVYVADTSNHRIQKFAPATRTPEERIGALIEDVEALLTTGTLK